MHTYREIPPQKPVYDSQSWIKGMGNIDPFNHEIGDMCTGILENKYFTGIYKGGALTVLSSFTVIDSYALVQ